MYELTEHDVREPSGPEGTPSVIRAAKLGSPHILKALLDLGSIEKSPSCFLEAETSGAYTSALLTAINSGFSANVNILLSYGADPNGFPLECFSRQSVAFLRFRLPRWEFAFSSLPTRTEAINKLPHSQTEPLTRGEITLRQASRARFWSEPSIPIYNAHTTALTALEAAAMIGDNRLVDQLLDYGADVSAWKQHLIAMPVQPSISYLAISSPLHHAIESNHLHTISHLLDLEFDVNNILLASITCSLTPSMTAIARHNLSAFRLMASKTDFALTTPIYGVHILHIAVATLSLEILDEISKSILLDAAPTTALLHTLLHVACLPLDDTHVNHMSAKCHASIHELRCLDYSTENMTLHPHPYPNQLKDRTRRHPLSSTPEGSSLSSVHSAQTAMVLHLLQNTQISLGAQDIHGNTPLHYLAGHSSVNIDLLDTLHNDNKKYHAQSVWNETKNIWGFTPKELFDERHEVEGPNRLYMPFWRDPMGYWLGNKYLDLL